MADMISRENNINFEILKLEREQLIELFNLASKEASIAEELLSRLK